MMFAVVMMNLTGTSGNLMSLGAIDFGLIVDAAVIIVENSVRRLSELRRRKGTPLTSSERTKVIQDAAVEVRSASIFGYSIIAIVYMPILTLGGMEGKLFHPMAMTVLFALAGAFVASLTVVPELASSFLVPNESNHEAWLMRHADRAYRRSWTADCGIDGPPSGLARRSLWQRSESLRGSERSSFPNLTKVIC
jgi:cobalt-zinc-cadmium resistance protein CzcA